MPLNASDGTSYQTQMEAMLNMSINAKTANTQRDASFTLARAEASLL